MAPPSQPCSPYPETAARSNRVPCDAQRTSCWRCVLGAPFTKPGSAEGWVLILDKQPGQPLTSVLKGVAGKAAMEGAG
eukprot:95086-Alexandrium_andersonii.AAC.1